MDLGSVQFYLKLSAAPNNRFTVVAMLPTLRATPPIFTRVLDEGLCFPKNPGRLAAGNPLLLFLSDLKRLLGRCRTKVLSDIF